MAKKTNGTHEGRTNYKQKKLKLVHCVVKIYIYIVILSIKSMVHNNVSRFFEQNNTKICMYSIG